MECAGCTGIELAAQLVGCNAQFRTLAQRNSVDALAPEQLLTGGVLLRAAIVESMAMSTHQTIVTAPPKKQRGHTAPRAPLINIDQPGRLRVANVMALLGISHATLYAGLKLKPGETTTRYPKPDGWDGKFPWWRTATIKAFIDA